MLTLSHVSLRELKAVDPYAHRVSAALSSTGKKNDSIVDLPFSIMTCRFLLAIVFHT